MLSQADIERLKMLKRRTLRIVSGPIVEWREWRIGFNNEEFWGHNQKDPGQQT